MTAGRTYSDFTEALVDEMTGGRTYSTFVEFVTLSTVPRRYSDFVEVVVGPCIPPANDDIENAEVLSGTEGTVSGTTVCATFSAAEAVLGYSGESRLIVHYTWTATTTGRFLFRVDPLDETTGTTDLQVSSVTNNGAARVSWGEHLPVDMTVGEEAQIEVASENGADFELSWSLCTPLNDKWANAEVLVGNSGSVTGTTECATLELEEPGMSCF